MTDETRKDQRMDDVSTDPDVVMPPAATAPADAPPRRHRRKWPWVVLALVVFVPVLVLTAWTAITLNWSYSKGSRAGYIQKFSKKGWLCKTWEGEIAMVNVPGAAQERFAFTVRSDSLARVINSAQGQRVVIEYDQHKGIPTSCFGETEYFVNAVRILGP